MSSKAMEAGTHHEETAGTIPENIYANDFGVLDFISETQHFDLFNSLVPVENESNQILNFASQGYDDQHNNLMGDGLADDGQVDMFGFDLPKERLSNVCTNSQVLDAFANLADSENMQQQEEEEEDEDESSATTTTNTPTNKKSGKHDRSRTLVIERKRRSRMKEKLYNLRSLVPNITKMDKASIVGDAVLYVQDLQRQAKKLKSDIASLESSLKAGINNKGRTKKTSSTTLYPIIKKIIKMDIYQLQERAIYVRLVSAKGKGIVALLYKALESLTSFSIRSSNLAASDENYVFTFTLTVLLESKMDLSLPNLKLWIASVFLEQGFDFETMLPS